MIKFLKKVFGFGSADSWAPEPEVIVEAEETPVPVVEKKTPKTKLPKKTAEKRETKKREKPALKVVSAPDTTKKRGRPAKKK